MMVSDGQTTLFWKDCWIDMHSISESAPQLHACIPMRRQKARTIVAGLQANTWARNIHSVLCLQEIG
jgi:hypothetical protein